MKDTWNVPRVRVSTTTPDNQCHPSNTCVSMNASDTGSAKTTLWNQSRSVKKDQNLESEYTDRVYVVARGRVKETEEVPPQARVLMKKTYVRRLKQERSTGRGRSACDRPQRKRHGNRINGYGSSRHNQQARASHATKRRQIRQSNIALQPSKIAY